MKKKIPEGHEVCRVCEGTGINLDRYLSWLRLCVKSKTRHWDHNIIKFAEIDHKMARKFMISYIKKGAFKDKDTKPWLCYKCEGRGIVDWVSNAMG